MVCVDEDGDVWEEYIYPPPLFVFADFEVITDEEGVQTPILLCLEDEENEDTISLYGEDCVESMFEHLDSLTTDEYCDERRVVVVFRNFKGYDGMFPTILIGKQKTRSTSVPKSCPWSLATSNLWTRSVFCHSLCLLSCFVWPHRTLQRFPPPSL